MTLSGSIFGGNFSFSGQRQIGKEGRALWIRAFRAASWIALNRRMPLDNWQGLS